jgi:hypothetical protein
VPSPISSPNKHTNNCHPKAFILFFSVHFNIYRYLSENQQKLYFTVIRHDNYATILFDSIKMGDSKEEYWIYHERQLAEIAQQLDQVELNLMAQNNEGGVRYVF